MIERNVMIANSEIESLDSALSWVVQMIDAEFAEAKMVSISIEQISRLDPGPDTEWRYTWTAAVRGLVGEHP